MQAADAKVQGILQDGPQPAEVKATKGDRPHVTWDEEQLAEHDKTRGNKMKIDEPKTPYVTDEEFRKVCADDPEYQKEYGDDIPMGQEVKFVGELIDAGSCEANNNSAMDMSDGVGKDIGGGGLMNINKEI